MACWARGTVDSWANRPVGPVLPRPAPRSPAPPPHRAPPRPDSPVVCPGFGFDKCLVEKKPSVHCSAARNEERPLSRSSTTRQPLVAFRDSYFIRFDTFVPSRKRSGRLFSLIWNRKKSRALDAQSRPTVPRPAKPGRGPAQHRPTQKYVRVLDSTNEFPFRVLQAHCKRMICIFNEISHFMPPG